MPYTYTAAASVAMSSPLSGGLGARPDAAMEEWCWVEASAVSLCGASQRSVHDGALFKARRCRGGAPPSMLGERTALVPTWICFAVISVQVLYQSVVQIQQWHAFLTRALAAWRDDLAPACALASQAMQLWVRGPIWALYAMQRTSVSATGAVLQSIGGVLDVMYAATLT